MKTKTYLAILLLGATSLHADDAVPRLAPGQSFSIQFPEMPPTLYSLLQNTNVPATMTVFLPRDYDPQRKHPLLIFLSGGNGGRGQSAGVSRKLSEEKDFVCVDLPLFKEKVEPPSAGSGTSPMLIRAADCTFMWPLFRTMLAKLEATVPNLDPSRWVLGGFSNGGHTTAGLIDQSDGEVARRFAAFFCVEGGGRLERYDLLKDKPFLMLYGSAKARDRMQEIYSSAVAAGVKATLLEMKDAGHDFPESQYPVVRAWLRETLGLTVTATGATGEKGVEQNKTGAVVKVDADGRQLTVMAARALTFTITDPTVITQNGTPAKLADIRTDDKVSVDYVRDGETRTARKIAILKGGPSTAITLKKGSSALEPGDSLITVSVGAQTRTCLLHVPVANGGVEPLPLVIALHGSGGTGRGMAGTTGFSALADKQGFLAAYPDGIIGKGLWNSLLGKLPGGEGVTADEVDDVAFIRALIDSLQKSHRADPNRVFVCGHSAGAYMSYRLAVELADRIAAVGIVNGSLGIKSLDGTPVPYEISQPAAPISVMQICGKLDNTVKFAGGQAPKNLYKSGPDCIRFFVKANGCAPSGRETRDAEHAVTRTLYTGGKAGAEVELIIVENCGHNWPTPQQGLSASQTLWEFFSKHPKAAR